MEESELYELIIEEVRQRLDSIKHEVEEIIAETLGRNLKSIPLMTREEAHEKLRKRVITMLDYIKQWHDNPDKYVAERLDITEHTIRDEWRVLGRSIPNYKNYMALEALYNKEREEHGNGR